MDGYFNGYQMYQQESSIKWVNGIGEALVYPVAPGKSVWLMDSGDEAVFYIKSVDMSGMPLPLRIFDYKERKVQDSTNDYVTKADLEKVIAELKREDHKGNKK